MTTNKIKKITLDSFRAFSENLDLNFDTGNEVADIVVVYAPNGTGKTSTIEGIEWAATGKISRIDRIIANNSSKNRNPKEGYILKNRHSTKKFGSVTIELENGEQVSRRTKPKLNRNNDYCKGIIDSTIDNLEYFKNHILSQGTISHLSYEASSGSLFKSLISNKKNEEDILIYDKLNEIKNKLDTSNIKIKNEISYITESIKVSDNELIVLERDFNHDSDFINSEEYIFFKKNFNSYQDISNKSVSESIDYLTELQISFGELKNRLINFDICSYKQSLKNYSFSSKIIQLENDTIEKKLELNHLKTKIIKIEEEEGNVNYYLNERNIDNITSKIYLNNELSKNIDIYNNKISKAVSVRDIIRLKSTEFDLLSLKENEIKAQTAEGIINTLFSSVTQSYITLLKEDTFPNKINEKIDEKLNIINSITKSSFIKKHSEQNNIIELEKKHIELERINLKINELTSEKEKIISFEEKLGLIKSYVIEAINDKNLSNCPACGTKYDTMDQLLETVSSFKTDSKSLVDGAIDTLNNQKIDLVSNIENINQQIDQQISQEKIILNNDISQLHEKKILASELYSLLKEINIKYTDNNKTLSEISIIKTNISNKVSLLTRKKIKYTQWLSRIDLFISEKRNELDDCNLELKKLTESCINSLGTDINRLAYISSLHHVYLFKNHELNISSNETKNRINILTNNLENIKNDIFKLRHDAGFSHDSVMKDIMETSINNKKTIRLNYNYLKDRIKTYNITKNIYFIEFIVRLEEKFSAYIYNIKTSEKIQNKKENIITENKALTKKTHEKIEISKQLEQINNALNETMKYFSKLASNSINNDILNDMFMYIEPHLKYDEISFKVELNGSNKGIYIQARSNSMDDNNTPIYYLSEAQINILSICIFLAEHAKEDNSPINTIIIDDPVQSMDDLNSYALIDLCKIFTRRFKKQIIITTHNRSFFNLFRDKLPEERYSTKYICL